MQTVVAALIRKDGQILIAQRNATGPHPLKWEFPGGKLEPAESAEQALARELQEELGIEAVIGPEFTRYEYTYPGKSAILLAFYQIESYTGELQNKGVFEAIKWEPTTNLTHYDFLEGDLALVQLLSKLKIDQV